MPKIYIMVISSTDIKEINNMAKDIDKSFLTIERTEIKELDIK